MKSYIRVNISIGILFAAIISVFIIISCKDKEENEDVPQNQAPIVQSIESQTPLLGWGGKTQICVKAIDPEGADLSYSWTSSSGEFITSTSYSCVTWVAPMASGPHTLTVLISDSIHSISKDIIIDILHPPFLFNDEFNGGSTNWAFDYCEHIYENDALSLISTDTFWLAAARSYSFFPYVKVPWGVSANVTPTETSSSPTSSGVAVHLNVNNSEVMTVMLFAVRFNDESINWGFLWWFPNTPETLFYWGEDCRGKSSHIHTDGQTNHLEMSVSENRKVTLTANGHKILFENNAINEFISYGYSTSLNVDYIKLYGGTKMRTSWDNVEFYSTSKKTSSTSTILPTHQLTEEDFQNISNIYNEGKIVCLKDAMFEKQR